VKTFSPFKRSFYERSAEIVAPELLGHWLIRNTPQGPSGGLIVETEAYLTGDPASHAYMGKTPRNQIMFGPPGRAYVYFIYGNHWCFNAVCRPAGIAEAVLIRGLEPAIGLNFMRERRPVANPHHLTNGPGKLCLAMKIDRSMNGVDLCDATSALFIAANEPLKQYLLTRAPLVSTTRVGITRAASLPLRFCLAGSPCVSRKVAGRDVKPFASGGRGITLKGT
jgi:DNA-3-methyladenine glycosylase